MILINKSYLGHTIEELEIHRRRGSRHDRKKLAIKKDGKIIKIVGFLANDNLSKERAVKRCEKFIDTLVCTA